MPPRTASSCSRAIRRRLVSHGDNTWVSEALLASVFERYFAVSHVPRRRASSTPGPLESRRRLGKRRIGDLNAGYAPSSLPDWASPDALDLSKWKWEPPTLVSVREAQRQAQLQLTQHWLGRWLLPPSARDRSETVEPPPPPTTLESLQQFRSRVSAEQLPDLMQACDDICLQLKNSSVSVADRGLLVESLSDVLAALDERFGGASDAVSLFAPLYSAVVGRLFATPKTESPTMDSELSRSLLTQLLVLDAGDELCRLFELTMGYIPAKQRDNVLAHVEAILDKFFLSWSKAAISIGVSQVQIKAISGALSLLSWSKPSVFRAAERLLLEHPGTPEQQCHVRHAWLRVLAQLPVLGTNALLKAFATLLGDRAVAAGVSNLDLCELLLQHWSSTGRVGKPERVRALFGQLLSSEEPTPISALAHALYTLDGTWEPRIVELCRVLRDTGRINELAAAFGGHSQHQIPSPRLLRKVAIACGDSRVALALHDVYRTIPKAKRHKAWSEEIWSRYLEQAVCDPSTPIKVVWRLLRLCKPSEATAEIAAKLAYEQAHSGNLSTRATLRRVEECIAFLQMGGAGLPPRALIAAYRVVTRDLAGKDWGRTSRLVWFVDLVRRECGAEKAEECRNMLRSWRQLVGRVKAQEERAAEEKEE